MPKAHFSGKDTWLFVCRDGSWRRATDLVKLQISSRPKTDARAQGSEVRSQTPDLGDFSLLGQGPRSADVVANEDSTVLKMSAPAFEKLAEESPELATQFLLSTSKTLAARIRADNKRLRDSVSFSRAAGTELAPTAARHAAKPSITQQILQLRTRLRFT